MNRLISTVFADMCSLFTSANISEFIEIFDLLLNSNRNLNSSKHQVLHQLPFNLNKLNELKMNEKNKTFRIAT